MIAIIDSGIGGLSIFQGLRGQFPNARMLYFADTVNFPYGSKSKSKLVKILKDRVELLLSLGAKIIVVACNTATVNAAKEVSTCFSVPIIGVEPDLMFASEVTKNGKVGLIATEATIRSGVGSNLPKGVILIKKSSKNLATLIENNLDNIDDGIIQKEFDGLINKNVDTVVLGCTHYHFLLSRLSGLYPGITFITPEDSVVARAVSIIEGGNIMMESGRSEYYSSSANNVLEKFIIKIGLDNDPVIRIKG